MSSLVICQGFLEKKSPHNPTSQDVREIASKFAGVELKEAIEQLQLLLYSA